MKINNSGKIINPWYGVMAGLHRQLPAADYRHSNLYSSLQENK